MPQTCTVVLALVGIGIFAIPAGLLASAFTDQLRIDRDAFKQRLMRVFEDGAMSAKEQELITAEAERLHLSHDEVQRLTEEARAEYDFVVKAADQEIKINGGVVLDAKAHPDLAVAQFKLLVAHLKLVTDATGAAPLREGLNATAGDARTELEILSLLSPKS